MERSTEFGVPVSKEPTDKLGWLGASGVSPQLPSGAIVQDGATYVPLIGMALQTEGTAPPMPINTAIPYVAGLAPGENGMVEASAAYESAIYNEAVRKIEEAAASAGNLPDPDAAGRAPIEVYEVIPWACSGDDACASSSNKCTLRSLFGEPELGNLWLAGHVECGKNVSGIQIDLCFYAWKTSGNKSEISNYKKFGCYEKNGKTGARFFKTNVGNALIATPCGSGETYRAWAWAYVWSGSYKWSSPGQLSGIWVCEGPPDGGEQEGIEGL